MYLILSLGVVIFSAEFFQELALDNDEIPLGFRTWESDRHFSSLENIRRLLIERVRVPFQE